ncbi:MAG: hypothetical protein FWH06_07625 [Oscillospiraceae bacterium]|nr:hypothetical protein [Oscillospiraceae bacterium]
MDGVKTQRLVIHYNCVGAIEIPEHNKIPLTAVKMDTRKGVAVATPHPKLLFECPYPQIL